MSKIKFGNFITYNGRFLSTAIQKAQSGNLVFARISNSPKADNEFKALVEVNASADAPIWFEGVEQTVNFPVNNVGKDGYYIFGGKADGHLVTFDDFNAVKKEVKELIGAGELAMPKHDDGTYYSIVEYVNGRLETLADYKVKDVVIGATSIVDATSGVVTLGDAARKNVAAEIVDGGTGLVTADLVYDYIDAIPEVVVAQGTGISVGSTTADGKTTYTVSVDSTIATQKFVEDEIGKLGDVMSFIGVVTEKPTDANVTLVGGTTAVAATNGDVVTVQASGEEYIWTGTEWIEIGKVSTDEAVTSLGNVKGDITLGDGLSMVGQQLTVTFPDAPTADDLAYTHEYGATGVTSVKTALDDLYDGEETTAESLTDLNDRLTDIESKYNVAANIGVTGIEGQTNVQGALEDLYSKVGNIEVPVTSVGGDTASYSDVTTDKAGNVTVKNTLATPTAGATGIERAEATGLATDAWVKDYVAELLAWETLAD